MPVTTPNSPTYRRVPTTTSATSPAEIDSSSNSSSRDDGPPPPPPGSGLSLAERLTNKAIAVFWVGLAIWSARYTHLYSAILSAHHGDDDATAVAVPNRILLNLFFATLGTNVTLLCYLVIYLPHCKGLDSTSWVVYCPRVIPTMCILGVLGTLLLLRACWSVWGFVTPALLGTQAMGGLFATHFVPWWC